MQQTPVHIMLRLKFHLHQKMKVASFFFLKKRSIDTIDLEKCDIFIFVCGFILYLFIKKEFAIVFPSVD